MKKKKKSIGFRIVLLAVIIAAAIIAVIFAVMHRSGGDIIDSVRDLFGIKGDAAAEFYYENAEGRSFAELDDAFAVASVKGVTVFKKDGRQSFSDVFVMSSPAVRAAGKYGIAYDIGGNNARLFAQEENISELITDAPIISASVNKKGCFAVCTEEEGYNGLVTVYNKDGSAIYKWHCGSGYVLSADVSSDGRVIALIFNNEGSSIVYLDLDSETELCRFTYDDVILDARFVGDTVAAVTRSELLLLTDSGDSIASYDYSDRYLKAYSIGSGFVSLALGDYQFSGTCDILAVDMSGALMGTAQFPAGSVVMDASGKYIAVMGMGSTKVYTSEFKEYAAFETSGTAGVLMLKNGQVMILDSYSSSVYPKNN